LSCFEAEVSLVFSASCPEVSYDLLSDFFVIVDFVGESHFIFSSLGLWISFFVWLVGLVRGLRSGKW
jgi:hypothetical protein